jgi:hypothetical protein
MPQSNQISLQTTNVYEVVNCGATKFVAFACALDGSNNPIWQVGTCTDLMGNNFVPMLEINCVSGQLKVNGTVVTIP